jgi:hypothetical protein
VTVLQRCDCTTTMWLYYKDVTVLQRCDCTTTMWLYYNDVHQDCPWFQASAMMLMRYALFWVITRRQMVMLDRRFGTTYRSHLQGSTSPKKIYLTFWPLKMRPIRCPETSVMDYHSTLRNNPKDCRFYQECLICVSLNVVTAVWRY